MLYDSHVHSIMSSDSSLKIEELMNYLEKNKMGCVLTEHMEMYNANSHKLDTEEYFKIYNKYRGNKIYLGVEIGMDDLYTKNQNEYIKKYNFDYVIGSMHRVKRQDIYDSFNELRKSNKISREYEDEWNSEYLDETLKLINECKFINCLGHIDYPSRYSPFKENNILYSEYKDKYNRILECLIDTRRVIELNTKSIEKDERALINLTNILHSYKKLGGKYITYGTDAHKLDDLGRGLKLAKYIITNTSLKIVHFVEGKIVED